MTSAPPTGRVETSGPPARSRRAPLRPLVLRLHFYAGVLVGEIAHRRGRRTYGSAPGMK